MAEHGAHRPRFAVALLDEVEKYARSYKRVQLCMLNKYFVKTGGDRQIPTDDSCIMKYYIYDMNYDHDGVKDNLSELARVTFEDQNFFESCNEARFKEEVKTKILSTMTKICTQTFGKCDPDNLLFSVSKDYDIQVYVEDYKMMSSGKDIWKCEISLQTPLKSPRSQSQGIYHDHNFIASFRYELDHPQYRQKIIKVLESHLRYQGIFQLDKEECEKHHIESVARKGTAWAPG